MIRLEEINIEIDDKCLLKKESINIHGGYIHVIMGKSGSGKTTLLHEIALLSQKSNCVYLWNDKRIDLLNDKEKANIRRSRIGYILQDLELISEKLSLRDNVICMTSLAGIKYNEEKCLEYMRMLNLNISLEQKVDNMSKGQRQRFALVLALMKDAQLIICDEPTSALDFENTYQLMNSLKEIARCFHKMIVIASHDEIVSDYADVLYMIDDKKIIVKKDEIVNEEWNEMSCSQVDKQFYIYYVKGNKSIGKFLMKIIYVFIILIICLSPNIVDDFIDKQRSLLKLYADGEIIISNTSEKIPYSTYNMLNTDIKESTVNMIKEMDNVVDVCYYWEMDGLICIQNKEIEVKVIPKNIDKVTISSSLSENIEDFINLDLSLAYHNEQYDFHLAIDDYMIKDYPTRSGINKEIIYIPCSMANNLFKKKNILQSSSVLVICENNLELDETISHIGRWMQNATISCESMKYIETLNKFETIQNNMRMFKVLLIIGLILIAFIMNRIDNKNRKNEITNLRINGFSIEKYYYLLIYENIVCILVILFSLIVCYSLLLFISNQEEIFLKITIMVFKCLIYIFITKIIPILIFGFKLFEKDISDILREV